MTLTCSTMLDILFGFLSWLWQCHQMETFSVLLALCTKNSVVTGEFSLQRPLTGSFDGFFIYAWTNGWANNWELMILRCHHAHYDITVMDAFSERSWYQSTSPKLTVRPCWGTFCVRGCHADYIKTTFWKIVIFNAYLRNNIMLSTPSSLIDSSQESYLGDNLSWKVVNTGLILGLCPANERRRYFVTTSLFGWAQP